MALETTILIQPGRKVIIQFSVVKATWRMFLHFFSRPARADSSLSSSKGEKWVLTGQNFLGYSKFGC